MLKVVDSTVDKLEIRQEFIERSTFKC